METNTNTPKCTFSAYAKAFKDFLACHRLLSWNSGYMVTSDAIHGLIKRIEQYHNIKVHNFKATSEKNCSHPSIYVSFEFRHGDNVSAIKTSFKPGTSVSFLRDYINAALSCKATTTTPHFTTLVPAKDMLDSNEPKRHNIAHIINAWSGGDDTSIYIRESSPNTEIWLANPHIGSELEELCHEDIFATDWILKDA